MPMMHEQRRIAAGHTNPQYLVLGVFKGDAAEDPGFPDKRWLTIDELRAALSVATIEEKIEEYEAASKNARVVKLAAPSPDPVSPEA